MGKSKTPTDNVLQLKKDRAQATKKAELYKAQLTEAIKSSNVLSKQALDDAYDPADPTSTQKAIDAHNLKVQTKIDEAIASIDAQTAEYVSKEYSDDKINLQSSLAVYNATNNTDLTYEQLTNDIPPRIMKQFEEGKLKEEELFKASNDYLQTDPTPYTPETPIVHDSGNPTPVVAPEPVTVSEDGMDDFY